ncbi:MAG: flagellar biosynthesis anti-sigma factor FlgM [Roseateles depolymerans]|uniref:Negative regulator of flagellin synthesis n=1 Tax=Roseateles depolymerans TaxID=76731 RepID=A0A2W5FVI3_9BURK|nr:MAG: flagellar biosynthesis anti-sigma factor FlgM [Roseateles depolymerans]
MKIGNSPDASVSPPKADSAAGRKAEAPVKAVTTAAAQPSASAQVAISSAAAQLATGQVEDGSFDAAKVERISRAISEGKFTINANAIADKLVANAQELLSARNNKH